MTICTHNHHTNLLLYHIFLKLLNNFGKRYFICSCRNKHSFISTTTTTIAAATVVDQNMLPLNKIPLCITTFIVKIFQDSQDMSPTSSRKVGRASSTRTITPRRAASASNSTPPSTATSNHASSSYKSTLATSIGLGAGRGNEVLDYSEVSCTKMYLLFKTKSQKTMHSTLSKLLHVTGE